MSDLGTLLKGYEHVFVFLTLVGVLVLIYFLLLKPAGYGLSVSVQGPNSKQGFMNYGAGNIGYYSDRTDSTGALENADPRGLTAAQSYGLRSNGDGFSNGAYEPPVYWPAGSLGLINAYDQVAVGSEGDETEVINDPNVMSAINDATKSGFRNKVGNYAMGSLQGFRNRRKAGMQNALDKSLMGF
jgi:hypothetical protein